MKGKERVELLEQRISRAQTQEHTHFTHGSRRKSKGYANIF